MCASIYGRGAKRDVVRTPDLDAKEVHGTVRGKGDPRLQRMRISVAAAAETAAVAVAAAATDGVLITAAARPGADNDEGAKKMAGRGTRLENGGACVRVCVSVLIVRLNVNVHTRKNRFQGRKTHQVLITTIRNAHKGQTPRFSRRLANPNT